MKSFTVYNCVLWMERFWRMQERKQTCAIKNSRRPRVKTPLTEDDEAKRIKRTLAWTMKTNYWKENINANYEFIFNIETKEKCLKEYLIAKHFTANQNLNPMVLTRQDVNKARNGYRSILSLIANK